MAGLKEDIAAYEAMQEDLELEHLGKWVVIYEGELVDTYEDFQKAAADAVKRFGQGPYLIRQVGASTTFTLPASVLYRPAL